MTRMHLCLSVLFCSLPRLVAAEPGHQSLESIQEIAKSFAEGQIQSSPGEVRIEVGHIDPRLRLPICEYPLEAFYTPGARQLGNTTVGVRCSGANPWSLYVPITVKLTRKIVILANPLPRGATLGPADVQVESREVSSLVSGYLTEPAQALGKQLTQTLAPGSPLNPLVLKVPTLVRRGQIVVLLAKSGGVEVRMSGQALTEGAEGQLIQVRNLTSQQLVEGIVTADGAVHLSM